MGERQAQVGPARPEAVQARVAAVLLALALAAPTAAQHEHHGEALPAGAANLRIDIQDDDVVVGHPVALTVLLLDDAGQPRVHQDMHFRVTFADRALFEAPAAAGHDYDGFNEFTVAFPSSGPWKAELLDGQGLAIASLDGWAVLRERASVEAHLVGPTTVQAGDVEEYRMWPSADGAYLKHFYTQFEVWDEDGLTLSAKLHGHQDAQVNESVVRLAFPHAGHYTLRANMFQAASYGPQNSSFAPLKTEIGVDVLGPLPPVPSDAASPATLVVNGTPEARLVATVDPQANLALHTLARIAVRAEGNASSLRTHVDFWGQLRDAVGRVLFESDRLHESDGLLQVYLRPGLAGNYVWSAVADTDGTRIDVPFRVVDGTPAEARLTLNIPDDVQMAVPTDVVLVAAGASGAALSQAEALVQVMGPRGEEVALFKLHTAADGTMPFRFAFPSPGSYTLRVQPFTLGPGDTLFTSRTDWPVQVAFGEPWPEHTRPSPTLTKATDDAPSAGLAWASGAAALVLGVGGSLAWAAWSRRRG